MCQSIAQGGKRCIAHHPYTAAMVEYIALESSLKEEQVRAIFKSLRAEAKRDAQESLLRGITEESLFDSLPEEAALKSLAGVKGAARIMRRLESARKIGVENIKETDRVAFKNLKRVAKAVREDITKVVNDRAYEENISPADAEKIFWEVYARTSVPRNKNSSTTIGDARTTEALLIYNKSIVPQEREKQPRIIHQKSKWLLDSYGYDSSDGRLEVSVKGSMYSFHSVPEDVAEKFKNEPVQALREVSRNPAWRYSSSSEATLDGFRVRCPKCGQFSAQNGHSCPLRAEEDEMLPILGEVSEEISSRFSEESFEDSIAKYVSLDSSLFDNYWDIKERLTVFNVGSVENIEEKIVDVNSFDIAKIQQNLQAGVGTRLTVQATSPDGRYTQEQTFTIAPSQIYEGRFCYIDEGSPMCSCGRRYCRHFDDDFGLVGTVEDVSSKWWEFREKLGRVALEDTRWESFTGITPVTPDMTKEAISCLMFFNGYHNSGNLLSFEVKARVEGDSGKIRIDADNNGELLISSEGIDIEKIKGTPLERKFQEIFEEYELGKAIQGSRAKIVKEGVGEFLDSYNGDSGEYKDFLKSMSGWSETFEPGYSSNVQSFLEDYKQSKENGLPPRLEGTVMGGSFISASKDEPGARGFGIELEFEGADTEDIYEALRKAGVEVVEAEYGDSNYNVWQVKPDGSLDSGGEVVSPVLYDNEETWATIDRVCEILRSEGAKVNSNTGAHVHIGRGEERIASHSRGVHIAYATHQDVIHRFATNPDVGKHRGTSYSLPYSKNEEYEIYRSPGAWSTTQNLDSNRYRAVNQERGSTFEFRDFDGTLDSGRIQANVMMAAAVTRAGMRSSVGVEEWRNRAGRVQEVGVNYKRSQALRALVDIDTNSDEFIVADNIAVANALDSLFPNREVRSHILGHILASPWQEQGR